MAGVACVAVRDAPRWLSLGPTLNTPVLTVISSLGPTASGWSLGSTLSTGDKDTRLASAAMVK